jgi:hypothetical protein
MATADATSLFVKLVDKILVIDPQSDGAFLYTLEANGSTWDSWHFTVQDAKEQANFDAGIAIETWRPIPVHLTTTAARVAFAKDSK